VKDLSTARLLPSGDAPSPFGLHLVLGPLAGGSEEGPVPLPLSSDEGTSRVYLGALKGDADSIIELVAVKLLPNVLADALAESCAADEPVVVSVWWRAFIWTAPTAGLHAERSPWRVRVA